MWPGALLRKALSDHGQRMRAEIGGRVVAVDRIHLTLVFIGAVPVARIDALCAIGDVMRGKCFELDLTQTGCWRRSGVGWIAPVGTPAPLAQLVGDLRRHLAQADFSVDEKPFAPHITLLRNVRCNVKPEQTGVSLRWMVDGFSLIRSQTLRGGPLYTPLMTWRLT